MAPPRRRSRTKAHPHFSKHEDRSVTLTRKGGGHARSACRPANRVTLKKIAAARLACPAGRAPLPPLNVVKLSATDVLAPPTMKNAAKCDTSCDLQNPVNHQNFERILRFRDIPGSMLVGVSVNSTRLSPPPSRVGGELADCACSGPSRPECTEASGSSQRLHAMYVYSSRQARVPRRGRELSTVVTTRSRGPPGLVVLQCSTADPIRSDDGPAPVPPAALVRGGESRSGSIMNDSVRTSDQARGPAEFKHITKRRKRN